MLWQAVVKAAQYALYDCHSNNLGSGYLLKERGTCFRNQMQVTASQNCILLSLAFQINTELTFVRIYFPTSFFLIDATVCKGCALAMLHVLLFG